MKKSKYFQLTELVCPHVYKRHGEIAWMFIDEKLIDTLDLLKEKIFPGKKIVINNWNAGGAYSESGCRCILCSIVKGKAKDGIAYMSAHVLGKGVDMRVEGITAPEARKEIDRNQILLPYPIRLENDQSAPTWVHLDVYDMGNGKKINYFTA